MLSVPIKEKASVVLLLIMKEAVAVLVELVSLAHCVNSLRT